MSETLNPMGTELDPRQLAEQLPAQAKEQGVELVGPNGLLNQLTKNVLETALDAEMAEHLGYDKHDPVGRGSGNSRNGIRAKTVLTEIGPVEIEVPRDTNSSFEPQIVKKRQRRLTGIDEIVLSLTAKGLTTGEVAAHFADVYGATVSKDTISRITDKVVGEMAEWCNRPLEAGLQGPALPGHHLVADLVDDLRQCLATDFGADGGGQMLLDIAQRHPTGIQRNDHLIDTAESTRSFGHQCR